MSRIQPIQLEQADEKAKALLDNVQKKLGMVPNLMKTLAHSPAALAFYVNSRETLSEGTLSGKIREQITLIVVQENGCRYCLADHYNPTVIHLKQRDGTMVTISRTPLEKLQSFQKRMGWDFTWASSLNNAFNWDYNVSFTQAQLDGGEACYNYEKGKAFPVKEAPGLIAFYKDKTGAIFHTYSCFARGLETFIGAYWLLDAVPKGRDEADLNYGMEWVRHHDHYEDSTFIDPYVNLVKKKP